MLETLFGGVWIFTVPWSPCTASAAPRGLYDAQKTWIAQSLPGGHREERRCYEGVMTREPLSQRAAPCGHSSRRSPWPFCKVNAVIESAQWSEKSSNITKIMFVVTFLLPSLRARILQHFRRLRGGFRVHRRSSLLEKDQYADDLRQSTSCVMWAPALAQSSVSPRLGGAVV